MSSIRAPRQHLSIKIGNKAQKINDEWYNWTLYVSLPHEEEQKSKVEKGIPLSPNSATNPIFEGASPLLLRPHQVVKQTPKIDKVIFELHPSFEPSVIEVSESPFEVSTEGWGVFDVQVKVFFKKHEHRNYLYTLSFENEDQFVLEPLDTIPLAVTTIEGVLKYNKWTNTLQGHRAGASDFYTLNDVILRSQAVSLRNYVDTPVCLSGYFHHESRVIDYKDGQNHPLLPGHETGRSLLHTETFVVSDVRPLKE